MSRLDGKIAVVTGAGSGIGRATAKELAAVGARVVLIGRRRSPLEETAALLPREASWACPADVTDRSQVDELFEDVRKRWDTVDILVNNAGVNTPRRSLGDIPPEDWARVLDVNLTGVFHCTRAAVAQMRGRGGRVVSIGSVSGLRSSAGGGIAYATSKFGLVGFTAALNREENPNDVYASAVHPGEVDTPILDDRPTPPTPEHRARMLRAEDVAEAVLFIVTRPPHVHVPEMVIRPKGQDL